MIYNVERDKIYIGQTADLSKRVARHNQALPNKKSSFTSKNSGEWILVYQEEYDDRSSAIRREKELKSARGRKFIWDKIHSEINKDK